MKNLTLFIFLAALIGCPTSHPKNVVVDPECQDAGSIEACETIRSIVQDQTSLSGQ